MRISYEGLHNAPRLRLYETLEFIGKKVPNDVINHAVAFCSFDNLQALEKSKTVKSIKLQPRNPDDPESYKMRRGIIGGYKDYLSQEDIEFIDKWTKRRH